MVSSGVFQSGFRPLFVRRPTSALEKKTEKNGKRMEKKEEKGERERKRHCVLQIVNLEQKTGSNVGDVKQKVGRK